jgi:hypothetical protein
MLSAIPGAPRPRIAVLGDKAQGAETDRARLQRRKSGSQ